MKYRKRPVVVEAYQWHGIRTDGPTPVPPGVFLYQPPDVVLHSRVIDTPPSIYPQDTYHAVKTIHGQITRIDVGDWIITEPDGLHHYPCKPDIFEATYEQVR